ncbi:MULTISPECIES: L-threonylcarbamoyladenylate synthase [unclassified Candidatus Frackibacter]|uniref:L-threonylcarbamoyladenylate synthase n=1 Tax=unclassified Candidatus Frackibacter TaxID=2648818 RepID=UPI00088CA40D|nr:MULTISPECIES: L-threonylcarbamoyladenylate synthase [unclassified Candidatus Frackibacter]SDC10760.1 translation factor SUA5 [Candidatus Frackibacter sp. WG11]SEM36937.1 translation factor SUA5 [Candidatus Frackibacter sp. WG12]SFL42331.1 translation factor SUA5 [Candidatus Frackibacter sp. WG13]
MKVIKGTKIFKGRDNSSIIDCSKILNKGELVAFPTETVYGLGANALDEEAVRKIFKAKGRPADNPLIVHIASLKQIEDLVLEVPGDVKQLSNKFWPGPLTLVLKKKDIIPDITTGGLDTIAIRMPDHEVALNLLRTSQLPIAAPSANLSGRPSPTTAQHVIMDLAGRIDAVIDGGATGIGVESTVLSLVDEQPTLLRPGGITYEELESLLGEVIIDSAVKAEMADDDQLALAPGMKYQHYSPEAKVILIEGEKDRIAKRITKLTDKYLSEGLEVGVMATKENVDFYDDGRIKVMGSRNNLHEISANIFKLLREFDEIGIDIILAEGLPTDGLGLAIMNRLRKAAAYQIINV